MFTVRPGRMTLHDLRSFVTDLPRIELEERAYAVVDRGSEAIASIAAKGEPAYGINTGFGRLAQTHIPFDQLEALQRNLVLSHAVGVGAPMPEVVVRLMMLLKIASLSRGHSGVRREIVDALMLLHNADVIPVVPEKGSVGASGDLAPLAHMSTVLLGIGHVTHHGRRLPASEGLAIAGLDPVVLGAKEGLALLNGTQASNALALYNLFRIENLFLSSVVSGALSVDAAAGSTAPFDARIHALRGQPGQIDVAVVYRALLRDSGITFSHQDCDKVQDPYSLRCQPQVMGACLDQIRSSASTLLIEANGVSDNPLLFPDTLEVLSGGNFHAEPVAFACDNLALAIAEIGALSERRIALLIDTSLSGLPPFLVREGGVNSGFMIAHVTAAALASENKTYAHPASIDSLPTSANQEDHVSMATFAARKLGDLADNVASIVAIELLAASQGVDLRLPHRTSPALRPVLDLVRSRVPHYEIDHYLSPDIEVITSLVEGGSFAALAGFDL